jgi:biotin synthase-related radical SAM superfamily protein
MTEMNAEIKAELIAIGSVDVDESLLSRPSASSAGPGTGLKSIFFKSGSHRVRLEINKESPLKMKKATGDFVILRDDKELARGELEPILAHCPEQAYITLSEQCIYDCKFCSVPLMEGKIKTTEEVVTIVENACKTGRLKVIALTSGIAKSPEDEIDRVVQAVKALKKYNIPIGVSVHPTKDSSRRLKDAGVEEIKYNVETMDRAIFQQVCKGRKGLSLDYILDQLRDAVNVFGKNKVSSNFIIGLGECGNQAQSRSIA